MKFKYFFSNDFETHDAHSDDVLKTKYYRADFSKAGNELKYVMHELGFELLEEIVEYQEFHFYKAQIEVIADIYSESYYRQGIDFKVNSTYLFPNGRGYKMIEKIYSELDKRMERTK